MSEAITTQSDTTSGADDQQSQTAGVVTPATKTFTQDELNQHIQARLAEQTGRLERKHAKELSDALAKKDAELTAAIDTAVSERLKAQELDTAKAAIVRDFGLSEKQAAALSGSTAEELAASAEELFGKLRKVAPTIPTGEGTVPNANDTVVYTRAQLRDTKFFTEHRSDILAALREGRITG